MPLPHQVGISGRSSEGLPWPDDERDGNGLTRSSQSIFEQPFVIGSIQSRRGPVPQISSTLTWRDHLGTCKVRWGIGRMDYRVEPGLYALGKPGEESPVLVTANYKMSFDKLRKELVGRNFWILVLDTKGVNVWCSAAKGTFGTMELVSRIASSGLPEIISHRELILPQLAGPGVSAHEVKKLSGFKVIYGPIRSRDLFPFLDRGLKATPEMRLKTFAILERIALIPIELIQALKAGLAVALLLCLLSLLLRKGEGFAHALNHALFSVVAIVSAIFVGSVLTPILLPWLPGRAFSLKGLYPGLLAASVLTASRSGDWVTVADRLELIAWFLLIPAMSSYLAMNFTGASTYTSLSGVKREMRWALPLQIGAAVIGFVLWVGAQWIA